MTQRHLVHGCEFHQEWVGGDRRVVNPDERTFPHTVESCCGDHGTEWLFDGKVLICKGCGLDST